MHIIFDWDGTIAKTRVAHEASIRRSKTLGKQFDPDWLKEAMKTDSHYSLNKRMIQEYTGVSDDSVLKNIMTDLFRYHYLGVANDLGDDVLHDGMRLLIETLKRQGHVLSIATSLRKDIVDDILARLDMKRHFDCVEGNNPTLDYSKYDLVLACVEKCGPANFVVGDKSDDIDAGRKAGARGILVEWGTHRKYENADMTVSSAQELLEAINSTEPHLE